MLVTGTHFSYYHLCHRKLWLFANGISMEHTSELVYDGKLLHETSYKYRSGKFQELAVGGIKIDFYDTRNKVIHETKRSASMEEVHEWQLKYYIYVLAQHGMEDVSGVLEYPRLRTCKEIVLSEADRDHIEKAMPEIRGIISKPSCPEKTWMTICKKCSYFDFCWSDEETDD